MKRIEIVQSNAHKIGFFLDGKYEEYSDEEQKKWMEEFQIQLAKKEKRRALFSTIIGFLLLLAFFVLLIFNLTSLIQIDWFTFTFVLLGVVVLWVIFYFLFGLLFYPSFFIHWHLKNKNSKNPNHCVTYASSDYGKWVDHYLKYLGSTNFFKEKKNGKKEFVNFCLYKPKTLKSFVYNGYILSNIYYYYLSYENKKICFMPGFIIYQNKNNSKIFSYQDFSFDVAENDLYTLKRKNEILIQFYDMNHSFNLNFFHFHF